MGFRDLSEFFKPGLELPIRGKTYIIPAANAEDGLRLKLLMANPTVSLTDEGELREIMKLLGAEWEPKMVTVELTDPATGLRLLDGQQKPITEEYDEGHYHGGVYQEMVDDGLTWDEIMHAGRTALVNAGLGRTMAEATWEVGQFDSGNPLPPKPGAEGPTDKPEPNRATRRAAAKKAAPKKSSSKGATGSTTRARKRTAKTTQAGARTTR